MKPEQKEKKIPGQKEETISEKMKDTSLERMGEMDSEQMEKMGPEQEKTSETMTGSESGSAAEKEAKGEPKPGKKPKPNTRNLVSAVLIVAGLILIVVPIVITQMNMSRNEDIIDQFLREAEAAIVDYQDVSPEEEIVLPVFSEEQEPAETPSPEPVSGPEATPPETTGDDSQEGASGSVGAEAAPAPTKKPLMSEEEILRRMTGVLIIEKINLRMIIMDGVDEETLRVAAGRMPETGNFDEIGNVVLAGHRNYTFGKYFNRLDELEPGDRIIVQTKTRKLEYEVYKKHIIEPTDLSILEQSETEKILTLFTCHPVAIASHRLVVHAKQIN